MISLTPLRNGFIFAAVWCWFANSLLAEPVVTPGLPALDERQIEGEREKALTEALSSVDPAIAQAEEMARQAQSAPADSIDDIVFRLRGERTEQFRYLPWSHVKKMINAESVAAKGQFIGNRDKNLETIMNRAVSVHIPAQVARERVGLARFRIAKALRDFLPEASLTADIKQGVLTADSYNSDNWKMHFRQPIFRGGVLWNTLFLEWSNMEIAQREYDKTISDLIADVSQAYFEFERTQNVLHDRTALFERATEQKRISDQKHEANLISEIEKLNADSLYSQAQYDLETAEQEHEVAKLDLQKFLDLKPQDPVEVNALYHLETVRVDHLKEGFEVNAPGGRMKFDNNLEGLVELAYEHRADLQVESSKLKATQFAYRVAVGKRLPQADFIMDVGELAEAFDIDSHDPKHRKEFRVGVELTWALAGNTLKYTYDHDQRAPSVTQFRSANGTRTLANSFSLGILDDMGQFSSLIEAKISALEQVVELEKTEREVIRDVKESYFNFNKSLIQVESTYKRMKYRDRLAQLAKHRLGTNEIQISEYLQAELDHAEERALVYKALSELFLSQAKLNRAIGIREYMPVRGLE